MTNRAQCLASLARANEVRHHRAQLKQRLKQGDVSAGTLLSGDVPPDLATMALGRFLRAVPGVGRSKEARLLRQLHLRPSLALAQLTERQRSLIVERLGRWSR